MEGGAKELGVTDPEPAPTLSVEQHQAMIMFCSIIIERQITLSDFNDLRFENQTLPEIVQHEGWVPFLQRTGTISMDMVQDFYATILLVPIVSVRNTRVLLLPEKLARIVGYERPMEVFPSLPLFEEGQPHKTEIFQMMLGLDTIILKGSNMQHGLLLPFWRTLRLILSYYIDSKKHTTEVSFHQAEFMNLVAWEEPIDLALYIFQTVRTQALSHDSVSLSYGVLLTQFLHAMLVPEGPDKTMRYPLGPINKTTLSLSIAQTRRAQIVRATIGRQ
ncbi:hypothetical protein CJ030_MR6G005324 [Morella rubra]|uniref:Uncharacterized protein n=1 Tax=Morella rubra TaxID=262757 RepID=A0A6A1VA80_9ROSI|nr:hypothetical protein CJ030_MR6G005324 [Morella rubra]